MIRIATYTALRSQGAKTLLVAVFVCVLVAGMVVARRPPATAAKTADIASTAVELDPTVVQPKEAAPSVPRTIARNLSVPIEGSAAQRERVETELITIKATGFEPAALSRPAGKFLLDVDNRSEIEEVELRLDRQDGSREKSARVRSTAPEWRGALDLRPGVYILSEANHSSWICRITITSE